jgi:hypothetical protein
METPSNLVRRTGVGWKLKGGGKSEEKFDLSQYFVLLASDIVKTITANMRPKNKDGER